MKHSNHRNQVAYIKRSWYRELRADGWTAKAAKANVNSSIEFIDSVQKLAFEHGGTMSAEVYTQDEEI